MNIPQSKHSLKILTFLIILLVGLDCIFAWYEFYGQALCGDLIPLVLPDVKNAPILSDPFGIKALISGEYHPNINRYFCAASLAYYFKTVPFLLQNVVDPVKSLYLSSTLIKFFVYLAIILSVFRYSTVGLSKKYQPLSLLLIIPFLQIEGVISIYRFIDISVVYLFFYGLPFALMTYFFFPLFKYYVTETDPLKDRLLYYLIYFLIGFVLSFSSALASPVLLIFICFYFFEKWRQWKVKDSFSWKKWDSILFALFPINLYSLILGTFNSESANPISLYERFSRLGEGIIQYLIYEPTLLITWILSVILYLLLRAQKIKIWNDKFKTICFYFIAFIFVYVCFLPLGGYRDYRPLILRYDTLIPISLMSLIIVSTVFSTSILKLKKTGKVIAIGLFIMTAVYFTVNDYNRMAPSKVCEETILYKINNAAKDTKVLVINEPHCPVIDWIVVKYPEYYINHSKLWKFWNLSENEILLKFE